MSWLLLLVVLGGQVHTDHHFGPNDLMGSPGSQQVSLNTYYPDNPTIDALHILQQLIGFNLDIPPSPNHPSN